jgi:hypothetical protein
MLWKKIRRKDRKIPICPSDFFNDIKNRTDVKKSDGYKKRIHFLYVCVNEA